MTQGTILTAVEYTVLRVQYHFVRKGSRLPGSVIGETVPRQKVLARGKDWLASASDC